MQLRCNMPQLSCDTRTALTQSMLVVKNCIHCREGKIPDLSQADTSYYQVHKIQPITKHHILLLGFAITT